MCLFDGEIDTHKLLHKEFIKRFDELKQTFNSEGATLSFVYMINRVVVDWLINHIGSADVELANYINK